MEDNHKATLDCSGFWRDGFAILRGFNTRREIDELRGEVDAQLAAPVDPVEYESILGYPGAPQSLDAEGGRTPRRLLRACDRSNKFRSWALSDKLADRLRELFGSSDVYLSQSHHNCIMTKFKRFSSETGWHRDIRYWSFTEANLITVWLALDVENRSNGGLRLVPASHSAELASDRFDDDQFLRTDLGANRRLTDAAVTVDMHPGDLLFFHCMTLHSASWNRNTAVKRSLVFTYHTSSNKPLLGTRSDSLPEIELP